MLRYPSLPSTTLGFHPNMLHICYIGPPDHAINSLFTSLLYQPKLLVGSIVPADVPLPYAHRYPFLLPPITAGGKF